MSDSTKAVFLSYAHEDAVAARKIAEALRAFGITVWFDQNELRGGDSWDLHIRTQIKTCALFVPIISQQTQARAEGYFRREWKLAVDRTHDMAGGMAFLVPVVIDATNEGVASVPEEFMRYQWVRLPAGEPTPDFVTQIKRQLDAPKIAAVATPLASRAAPTAPTAPTPAPSSRLPWIGGAVAVAVVAVAGYFWFGRTTTSSGPAEKATVASAPAAKLTVAAATDKSIAVLPFANMSEEKDASAFFSDGMHEDILTNLALIRELRVVSRTSVMQYRDTKKAMKQIAEELGVTYILEGSVRRSGNKVRVTGQLIHAATDEHVWAKAYDRDLTDIFTIQSELSQQIAAALKTALSPEEEVLIARRPTTNSEAYDLFLRARDVANREGNTNASKAKQIEFLQRAVDLDPNFAAAWGELANVCAFSYFTNDEGMDALLARATRAIERAKQLAPDSPDVIDAVGTYLYYGFRDYSGATEQFERLARLQPNSPIVFNSLGLIQRRQGRWAQSLVNTRRATDLDPSNISYQRNLSASLLAARRWDELSVVERRIVALLPDSLTERFSQTFTPLMATGSTAEMEAFFAGLSPAQRESPRGISWRKGMAVVTGNYAEYFRLDRLQPYFDEDGNERWAQAVDAAGVYFASGDLAGARARLKDYPTGLRALVVREPKNARAWLYLANAEMILGNNDEARRCLDRNAEVLPESRDALDGVIFAVSRASVYDLLGDKERALAEYQRLINVPTPFGLKTEIMKRVPSTLRGDPRFEALINDPKNNAPLF